MRKFALLPLLIACGRIPLIQSSRRTFIKIIEIPSTSGSTSLSGHDILVDDTVVATIPMLCDMKSLQIVKVPNLSRVHTRQLPPTPQVSKIMILADKCKKSKSRNKNLHHPPSNVDRRWMWHEMWWQERCKRIVRLNKWILGGSTLCWTWNVSLIWFDLLKSQRTLYNFDVVFLVGANNIEFSDWIL